MPVNTYIIPYRQPNYVLPMGSIFFGNVFLGNIPVPCSTMSPIARGNAYLFPKPAGPVLSKHPDMSGKYIQGSFIDVAQGSRYFLVSPLIHLSIASLSNLQTRPIRMAGILPSAAYLQMVISCSFKYFAISLVVIISGIIYSSFFSSINDILYTRYSIQYAHDCLNYNNAEKHKSQ